MVGAGRDAAITTGILANAGKLAADCGATAVFLYLDALLSDEGSQLDLSVLALPEGARLLPVTRIEGALTEVDVIPRGLIESAGIVHVPSVALTRMGQIKVAAFLAFSRDLVKKGETALFLSGRHGSGIIDTVVVARVGRASEIFAYFVEGRQLPKEVRPEVLERVVDLAVELGIEGREGKPIGALFVIGDTDRVKRVSHQLVLNPFKGYAEEERNVLDPALEETIKELSLMDGAFVIRGDGVIETCGVFLKPSAETNIPRGLGSRHLVAAGITAVTDSIAVAVSQSTGTVSIFCGGRMVTDIEKPRRHAHERSDEGSRLAFFSEGS